MGGLSIHCKLTNNIPVLAVLEGSVSYGIHKKALAGSPPQNTNQCCLCPLGFLLVSSSFFISVMDSGKCPHIGTPGKCWALSVSSNGVKISWSAFLDLPGKQASQLTPSLGSRLHYVRPPSFPHTRILPDQICLGQTPHHVCFLKREYCNFFLPRAILTTLASYMQHFLVYFHRESKNKVY